LTVAVTSTTQITREGAAAALSDLVVGDHVNIRGTDAAGVYTATRISAAPEGFRAGGLLSAVDTTAGTITLTVTGGRHNPLAGQSLTVTVPATTQITLDGTTAGLADLVPGDHVRVRGTDADGTYRSTDLVAY
jgi:hypothetical protein